MAEHIDARITRDLLRAIAPEDNFSLQVEHTHAELQAIEDVAVNLRVLKGWHGKSSQERLLDISSAE
jgi:hypothetical protein